MIVTTSVTAAVSSLVFLTVWSVSGPLGANFTSSISKTAVPVGVQYSMIMGSTTPISIFWI